MKNLKIIPIVIVVFIAGIFASPYLVTRGWKADKISDVVPKSSAFNLFSYTNSEDRADLSLFWNVWDRIKVKYVDENDLNEKNLIYGATKGMVKALGDPYTVFMDPEETKDFMTSLDGQLNGIGAELEVKDQVLVVVSPIKGSPAEAAGLLPGDVIYKIFDELAADMTIFEAVSKIRGERGTKARLTVIREGTEEPIELEITRDIITLESVTYETKENNIAYVSISQFTDNTKPEFNKAVSSILLKKPKGMILDLRFNGGGYLDVSVDILSELIDGKKEVVKIKSRKAEDDKSIYVSGNARLKDIPLVVLVNKGSASASEIVAGAIQDHKRGIVIGEKTFGKGSVQEVMDNFPDSSSLRVTIAHWFTPNGRSIEHEGIEPDRKVEITTKDLEAKKDTQLDAAIEYLKGL